MKENLGSFDRLLRIGIAIVLGALFFSDTVTGTLSVVTAVFGSIVLLTGMLGHCPLYDWLEVSTVEKDMVHLR